MTTKLDETTTAHTAGPWHAGPWVAMEGRVASLIYRTQHTRDGYVAKVYGETPDEVMADACLIAAAPTMLEALEALTCESESRDHDSECITQCAVPSDEKCRIGHGCWCVNLESARAAIRAAKGES